MTSISNNPVFVSGAVARQVFQWSDAVECLRTAYRLPESEGATPARTVATVGKAWLRVLPAFPPSGRYFGAKLMGAGVQGVAGGIEYVIVLFDRETSRIAAFVDANTITAYRTAATTALAMDALAPRMPARLAVLGSGLEAQNHARALAAVRTLTEVVVYSPNPEKRAAFAAALTQDLGMQARAAATPEEAVGGADIVLAAAGDVPTLEMLAAIAILRELTPELKIRFINVVDLMTLQPKEEHPHGLANEEFISLFSRDKPILFAYHGYPWLIHRLTYRRSNHGNLHVRGYKEEGTTTTPFDMVVLNTLDRFHLVMDVANQVPKLHAQAAHIKQLMRDKLIDHTQYIHLHGEDMPEIRDWKWPEAKA